MDFPTDRMDITYSYQANTSDAGWLVLNVNGLDLDGVNKIYIDLSQVHGLREKRTKKDSQAAMVRDLFAKKDEG